MTDANRPGRNASPTLSDDEREILRALEENPHEVLTETQAAEFLQWSPVTLRHRRVGHVDAPAPRWARLPGSKSIRYLRKWLIEFVQAGERGAVG